ncbi:YhgE/Pip family protein [Mycolicibacter kumamotonensis]|uniref:ABC transporter permease n=1 Tax=Mycolicibacter kumamotonensis TaxID=354243 RepID=A0A1B8SJF4_9MYCO|nr:YhgE/Pip family protein [Mycolicibacter kumamotonensis]NDJ90472.1 ABC transporter permease [Mycolicibacter kumamotonensis]OBY32867.1 membrane protein [Mycolicibacter kumamotonensis]
MLAGMSLGTDLKRYSRGTMPRLALITIIVLPLLYGAMYLWAFWNPFAAIDKIPVALVNEDTGATVSGNQLHAGDEVTRALVDSGQLDLHQVSESQAAKGVSDGTYYFSITLPEDFSAAVVSPAGPHPQKAQIQFRFNDANNYLASVMGQNAAREVLNEVSAKVGQQVIGTALTQVTDEVKKAAGGADRLSQGSKALADNLGTARDGSAALADGSRRLSQGVQQATDPLLKLTDDLGAMGFDPNAAGAAATALSGNITTVSDRIAALNVNYQQAAGIVNQVVDALRGNPDPAVRGLGDTLAGAQRLLAIKGLDPATDEGLAQLRANAQKLENDLADPGSGLRTFISHALDGGLKSDLVTLRNGAADLDAGAHKLSDGLTRLADGGDQLKDGAAQLASGLGEADQRASTVTDQQRVEISQILASPVGVDMDFTHHAATFGTGFAPFFLPLALFIGSLIVWMLLTPLQTRAIVNGLGALRVVLASYWPALLLGLCQVLLMYAVVHFGVGLQAKYAAGTVAFLALIAASFLALIQAFNAVLGVAVGRVFTLAFLMFQLVSSGGVYPVETTAKPFQILHPYDPMTYAVNGLRQLTVGGIDARMWTSVAVLAGILIVSLAASSWAARRDRQYTLERLYPPIEV